MGTWERLACTTTERRGARKVKRRRKAGREARRRRTAVSQILTRIITRRRRKRRRRREPKASLKAGPQSQVKLKIPTGGREERGLPLSLLLLQGEQPRPCDQHPLRAGHEGAEIQRHLHGASRDLRQMSRSRRES